MSKRTITLTGRPPVSIETDRWPLLASVHEESYEGQVKCQSFRTTNWHVKVRQHENGRVLVYAVYTHDTAWQQEESAVVRHGDLLTGTPNTEEIVATIYDVCERMPDETRRDWHQLADDCIADLPAEELA